MKKFTCLLLVALAITSTMAANCVVDDTNNAFIARIKVIQGDATAQVGTAAAEVTGTATVCGTTTMLCCVVAKMDTIITAQQKKVKDAFVAFGSKAATIGGLYTKYASITNASTIGTIGTPAVALGAAVDADRSGATADEFKGFGNYTAATFETDFKAFVAALPDCYTKYADLIGKVACSGCANAADAASILYQWKLANGGAILIKQATATAIAEKCTKVWNFMWKTGWYVQTVAYLNSKKGTGYTYPTVTLANLVFQSTATTNAATVTAINTAFTNCAADPTATACTTTNKAVLTQGFVEIYGTSTTGVGRSDVSIISATNYYSNARRMLPATTGSILVDETNGIDFLAAATGWTVTTPVTLVAADTTTWSSGVVATTSSSSSSSGTTTKNAKVVIGTILSALFAIAFLN